MARMLYRLGTFSARHRLKFFIGWALALILVAAVTLTGMKFSDSDFNIPGQESSKALSIVEDKFGAGADAPETSALQIVVQSSDAITSGDGPALVQRLIDEAGSVDRVVAVSNPFDPQAPYVSPDETTAVIDITFADLPEDESEAAHESIVDLAQSARDAGFTAEVGGSVAPEVPEILGPTEIVGAVLAFVVLLVTFGSLVAAGANMLTALTGVGVGVLGILAFSAISPIGSITPILAVMLGLAVGIDYGLFILARFRSELREGRSTEDAIGRAVGTAGSSVVFAGMTVTIALVGLSVVGIPFIAEMGFAAAFAVVVAVLVSLTLLPALMSVMGRRVLPKRERALEGPKPSTRDWNTKKPGFLDKWVKTVVRRPVISLISGVGVLLVLAVPVLSLQTALAPPGGEDPKSTERAAYHLVQDAFGEGSQSPLVVLVDAQGSDLEASLPQVESVLTSLPDVVMVTPPQVSDDGEYAMVTVIPGSDSVAPETADLVQAIRDSNDQVEDVQMLVTGAVAMDLDVNATLSAALVTYLVLIVGLSLVLLVVLFRSILVPVVATVGFLLSLGAGMGVMVAIFQWGWLDALISAPQGNPILSLLPILITGILFGLAMDYQVFLVSRMHEAHTKGLSPTAAIVDGFKRSAVVVVAAAAIMAAVFGGFALSPSSLVGSIALALTVGVVADAFVVRMIVVPAVLALLGDKAWWIPKWLDRVLPNIDAEGRALEDTPTPREEKVLAPSVEA